MVKKTNASQRIMDANEVVSKVEAWQRALGYTFSDWHNGAASLNIGEVKISHSRHGKAISHAKKFQNVYEDGRKCVVDHLMGEHDIIPGPGQLLYHGLDRAGAQTIMPSPKIFATAARGLGIDGAILLGGKNARDDKVVASVVVAMLGVVALKGGKQQLAEALGRLGLYHGMSATERETARILWKGLDRVL
ncbi:hypothetical protein GGTG_13033 [Gaeumannomyces tritici R3-111a-1]|uniref:RNase III domain-containing protein n=1 Tax=Gaeumannomyces tritici (strain R3-111a-1) TaxID=644352 RepID=J3PHQ2_GAET3|nr:hypothetical protein GGTG_13033 [Gaeumannomyces tritici R3-111a-1]EJT69414.1 hypothetical protein GGTG_13033 [Gaeumannomyces tritici R3-111a-1]